MMFNISAHAKSVSTPLCSTRRSACPALKYWGNHPQHDASDNVVPLDRLHRSRTARAGAAASRQPQPMDALTAVDSRMSTVNT